MSFFGYIFSFIETETHLSQSEPNARVEGLPTVNRVDSRARRIGQGLVLGVPVEEVGVFEGELRPFPIAHTDWRERPKEDELRRGKKSIEPWPVDQKW